MRPARGNGRVVGDRSDRSSSGAGGGAYAVPVLSLGALGLIALAGGLPLWVPSLYLLASLAAFAAYGLDKWAARTDRWRTAESTLHLLGLVGGWPGALLAQRVFRHKTQKASFRIVFWATVALNCAALAVLLWLA